MDILGTLLFRPLGFILNLCYQLVSNYGIAIFIFTLLTRVLLLPSSIHQQNNMAKQARTQAKVQKIQKKYANNKQKMNEEVQAFYQREGFNPMTGGCLAMLIPFPIMIALYRVIYRPLTYIAGISSEIITQASETLKSIHGSVSANTVELDIIRNFTAIKEKMPSLPDSIHKLNFNFFGLDLTATPSFKDFSWLWIIPIMAGASAFLVSIQSQRRQKRTNPDAPGGPMMGCMLYGMPLISLYFAFTLPAGVGLYWTASSLVMFIQSIILDKVYSPQKVAAKLMIEETIQRRAKERELKLAAGI